MRVARVLFHSPLIRFQGRRSIPKNVDHTPHPHEMSHMDELPQSFAQYRRAAQIHGPISRSSGSTSSQPGTLSSVNELPPRFHFRAMSSLELECINSGGAEYV